MRATWKSTYFSKAIFSLFCRLKQHGKMRKLRRISFLKAKKYPNLRVPFLASRADPIHNQFKGVHFNIHNGQGFQPLVISNSTLDLKRRFGYFITTKKIAPIHGDKVKKEKRKNKMSNPKEKKKFRVNQRRGKPTYKKEKKKLRKKFKKRIKKFFKFRR